MRARRIDLARWLPYASLLLAAAALAWVAHVLAAYSPGDILRGLEQLPAWSVALALGFSAAAYGALTLFDYFGLRYCGRTLPYGRVALASFTALSIGHTVGLAPFSSGAVRYRYYTRWGLRRGEVGLVILFCAVTVALGETAVSAAALLLRPQTAADILKLGRYFFTDGLTYDPDAVKKRLRKEGVPQLLTELDQVLATVEPFDVPTLEKAIHGYAEAHGHPMGQVVNPLRVAITGQGVGPGLYDCLAILGRETCRRRSAQTLAMLQSA